MKEAPPHCHGCTHHAPYIPLKWGPVHVSILTLINQWATSPLLSKLPLLWHTSLQPHFWRALMGELASGRGWTVACGHVLFRVSVPSNSSHTHTLQSSHHGTHVFFPFHKLHLNCSGRNQQSRPVDPQTKPLRSCSQAIPTRNRNYFGESTTFPHMDQQPGWQ